MEILCASQSWVAHEAAHNPAEFFQLLEDDAMHAK